MEDKLQLLTKKIYEEGVEKARQEAADILAEARKKAGDMVSEAQRSAQDIREQAQREADELRKNVNSEIQLSARQAISALKQEIANIVTFQANAVPLNEAIKDKDFLKGIIEIAVKNWSQNGHANADLALILPENARENVDIYLQAEVKEQLDKGLELNFSKNIVSGFRIGPADGSYVVSFSEKDFDNLFREYLRPKTIELLFGEK
jgi:V/A-type H+/Na+-transporting ATPase subunit E